MVVTLSVEFFLEPNCKYLAPFPSKGYSHPGTGDLENNTTCLAVRCVAYMIENTEKNRDSLV